MNLTSTKIIKSILVNHGIRPSKSLGQHFLINQKTLTNLIKAADLINDDLVLEIGPGIGTLTVQLARRVKRVVAVEKDKKMVRILREVLAEEGIKNVEIIEGDVLKISNFQFPISNKIPSIKSKISNKVASGLVPDHGHIRFPSHFQSATRADATPYKLVSNLPYQITSAVFEKFLEHSKRPSSITVMIQKEVGERITAEPGNMSMLSVVVQFFGRPETTANVPRTHFWPEPEVDSCIVRVGAIHKLPMQDDEIKSFFRLVRAGFSSRRKMLKNNLAHSLKISDKETVEALKEANLSGKVRAQELSIDNWKNLFQIFDENGKI